MLTKWGLTNFKSIYEADIDLAPLTVLTGTNSSGKSSLLQSMLMVAQTVQNKFYDRSLVLNGSLVDMGQFDDIMSYHSECNENGSRKRVPVSIRWTYEYEATRMTKEEKYSDMPRHKVNPIKMLLPPLFALESTLKPYDAPVEKRIPPKPYQVKIKSQIEVVFEAPKDREQLSPRVYSIKELIDTEDENKNDVHGEIVAQTSEVPLKGYLQIKNLSGSIGNDILSDNPSAKVSVFHFLPAEISYVSKSDSEGKMIYANSELLKNSADELNGYFSSKFKYLGPLRYHGSLYSISKEDDLKDLGISGEYTAAVLDSYADEKINYISSKCINDNNYIKMNTSLHEALIDWLKYLEVAEELKSEMTKHGYELKSLIDSDKESDFSVNLTHVGTGVSQVLPILVSCLLAEKGSTLIFEQPELHLHPAIQSRLADFFVSMAFLGKQCIVETHSEYLIDKLRCRIALTPTEVKMGEKIKIYFATKHGQKSQFQEIKINDYGVMDQWPEGFFDESQELADKMFDAVYEKRMKNGEIDSD